jgi:outer membrane protein
VWSRQARISAKWQGPERSDAAAETLRGTLLEAKTGAVPTLAVLDAEREAVEAEAALIEAEGKRHVAAWRLNALTGDVAVD